MEFSHFKEEGYRITENVPVSHVVFSVDLNLVDALDDSSELSGELQEIQYDDATSTYDVFDNQNKLVGSDLSWHELVDWIQNLN